jgi:hypothetical protein
LRVSVKNCSGFFGAAHIGLGYDLYQRYTGTVQVDQRIGMVLIVHTFTCILFHMNVVDGHVLFSAIGQLYRHITAQGKSGA